MSTVYTEKQVFDANGLPVGTQQEQAQLFDANGLPAKPQQTRAEWLESRRSSIGASEVAGILGLSKWTTPWEIWSEKLGRLEPDKGSKATMAGIALEPAILDFAEEKLGKLDRNKRILHADIPLAATCDAIVVDGGLPVEAKTTGIVGPIYGFWGDALTDEVPDEYLLQVHAQLMCTRAEMAYLFGLIPGRGIVEYHIQPNNQLHDWLADRIGNWWDRHIVQGIEPSHDTLPDLDVVKRLKHKAGKTIQATTELEILVGIRAALKEQVKEFSSQLELVETKLLLELGDAEFAELSDGRTLTYSKIQRRGYTVEPCEYRQIAIKKGKKK